MSEAGDSPSVGRMRTPGFDVARALALLGMVLVNFRGKMHAHHHGVEALVWLGDRLEGKAGALFVVLAGVGVSLRAHRATDFETMRLERRALLERAAILLSLGLLLMHLWPWDILHFYGVYLFLAIPLLRAQSWTLWVLAATVTMASVLLFFALDWELSPSLVTVHGALRHAFFNGLYPVFPWGAFVLVGMAVGRLDLTDATVRNRALWLALAVVVATEVVDVIARHDQRTGALGLGEVAAWLRTWPRAPRPLFVVSGSAMAVVVICLCIAITQRRVDRRWVVALVATGQLAFTLYIAHVIAILLPIEHGLLRGTPVQVVFAYGLVFYGGCIAFALWWRCRWEYGPFEGLIRQVTGRERPSPWRGARLR